MTNTVNPLAAASLAKTVKSITLDVRDAFPIRSFGQDTVYAPFASMPPALLVTLLYEGAQRILGDGAGGSKKTDAEKIAGMNKRIDAWLAGNFTITDRGESATTAMREAYIVECLGNMSIDPNDRAATRKAEKAINESIAATVTKVLGKDTKATFTNYLAAIATSMAKVEGSGTKDEILEALESKYEGLAAEAAKRLADSAKAISIPDAMTMDLSAFMKPKAS